MKYLSIVILLFLSCISVLAKSYFIATTGNDFNDGSIKHPFATLKRAYQKTGSDGDTIYLRGGVYAVKSKDLMQVTDKLWTRAFVLDKKIVSEKKGLLIAGYQDEKAIIDMSQIKPANKRIQAFYISGNFHHIKNIDIVGVQVTMRSHTQSECFRIEKGNNNIIENVRMHDGMGIGVYIASGMNNLILNCDAYNISDSISENGRNENTDGFGGHPGSINSKGNVFRGCRAWHCGDDGFDCINAWSSVTIDHCWSFLNGYKANGLDSKGNGNGIKAGGYGMGKNPKVPQLIPQHIVKNCIAYGNKAHGFYANHHLGGLVFINNSAYQNRSGNYDMVNRKSVQQAENIPGYNHVIKNNISFDSKRHGDISNVDKSKCDIDNNTFLPDRNISADDFYSLDVNQLMAPRKKDGSLPDITFMKPKSVSILAQKRIGYTYPMKE